MDASPHLRLDVLGAGPAYTDRPGATGAAYLVRADASSLLLDLGQGSLPRLFPHLEPSTLGAVAISHLHPDHFIDLVPLRHYLRWEFQPSRRVRVIGPAGLATRLDDLHDDPDFSLAALDIEPVSVLAPTIVGALRLDARPVTHAGASVGYRVSRSSEHDAPGLVYSGDCGRAEDLDALVRPGDTLLSEVSFGPGPVKPGAMHLDGPAVGRVAARNGAGAVLLTHLQMGHDPDETIASVRAAGYEGPVRLVEPGTSLEIGTAA
jgi:ribonuclease BN (tRNA processing enzyme)